MCQILAAAFFFFFFSRSQVLTTQKSAEIGDVQGFREYYPCGKYCHYVVLCP